ncbi:MAG: subclass B1 metallo-beta-lactamase, partial [Runella sp.]
HTVDNIVVWFPNEKVLYGGCLVKCMEAEDLGYIKEANLKAWPKTIRRLQKRYKNPRFIIPGHGDWRSGESLRHTLKLLKERG